jgi:hydroxyacylglutathione hydrolase
MSILTTYEHGIHAIDSGYERDVFDAIHLIVDQGRVALVDTAHYGAVPRVLAEMEKLGLAKESVDYVILTHVHLDHAGASGHFMREFPNAKLVVHPRGARHMIDPSKLEAAVHEVYGKDNALRMYGTLIPVPADRVIEATDGLQLKLGSRTLTFHDTPGHCRHHVLIHDSLTGHVFTGDTMGLSYRQFDNAAGKQFITPSTSPSQFDPEGFHRTLNLIERLKPEAAYLTHYAQVRDIPRLLTDMRRLIDAHVAVAKTAHAEGLRGAERHTRIKTGLQHLFTQEAASQGWAMQGEEALAFLEIDIELNAQGLEVWLDSLPSQTKVLEQFGSVQYDEGYDYKAQRNTKDV